MAVIASHPAGWYPDPSGHQYRYWTGSAWTDHVSDNGVMATAPAESRPALPPGAPASAYAGPGNAGGMRWYEPLVYIGILVAWLGITFGIGTAVGEAVLHDKVAYTQEQADRYNAEASGRARGVALVVALVAMAIIAPQVGYRGRDAFMVLIPIWGVVIVIKLLWRLACLNRRYWAPAPGKLRA